MEKAAILGVREAGIVDVPMPEPKENWALVKVHSVPMCTEYKMFVAGRRAEYLGHEAAGEVVAVAQPGRVKVGDRVVVQPQYPCGVCDLCVAGDYIHCQDTVDFEAFTGSREGSATYAQYLLKPDWLLSKIPDGVSYDMASLALCGFGPSFGPLDAMGVDQVVDADGTQHDWRRELREELLRRQRPDGSWINDKNPRWLEGEPALVTGYALLALSYCRPAAQDKQ